MLIVMGADANYLGGVGRVLYKSLDVGLSPHQAFVVSPIL